MLPGRYAYPDREAAREATALCQALVKSHRGLLYDLDKAVAKVVDAEKYPPRLRRDPRGRSAHVQKTTLLQTECNLSICGLLR